MKILLIEDDKLLCDILEALLQKNGYAVDIESDGNEGLYMAQNYFYDAIVLDIFLPSTDGLSILKALREQSINTPVLVLTSRGAAEDRVKGLNLGADDYLPKPLHYDEFLARLNAIIRRSKGEASPIIAIADLTIDTLGREAMRENKSIPLTAKEYNLLEYLALNAGRVVSRTELLEHLYDSDFESDSNIIDVYMTYLRNKIDRGFPHKLLHTVRGAGYVLRLPERS